jgi:hypothetical protein
VLSQASKPVLGSVAFDEAPDVEVVVDAVVAVVDPVEVVPVGELAAVAEAELELELELEFEFELLCVLVCEPECEPEPEPEPEDVLQLPSGSQYCWSPAPAASAFTGPESANAPRTATDTTSFRRLITARVLPDSESWEPRPS